MNNSRIANTARNIKSGLIYRFISIILPFINRTVILWTLGSEFTGLASLFASILNVLNIAELGFNSAVVYSLYKPIAEHDEEKISTIVSMLRKIYYIVGSVILLFGIIIMPFLTFFIKGAYPSNINIYLLYFLYLINSVVSYYLFAYKECLLIADQRRDISDNIRSLISIIRYFIQFIILITTENFYYYLLVAILGTIGTNITIQISTKKRYPYYYNVKTKSIIPKEIKNQIRGLTIDKICDTFRNSLDSLIISSFMGLVSVTIYGNYYYIYSALYGILLVICNAMSASVGNSIIEKSEKENFNSMLVFSQLFAIILGVCTTCLINLYQPFMLIWVGNDLMLSNFNMVLFCIYFYIINMNNIRNQYISGTGMWDKLKSSYIIEALANLILNIVLGKFLGITGVILATIITILVFNYFQRNRILFNTYYKNQSIRIFYKEQFYYALLTIISCAISYILCSFINISAFTDIVIKGIISFTVSLIVFLVCLKNSKRFVEIKKILSIVKRRKNAKN